MAPAPDQPPTISVIVVAYEPGERLAACLDAVAAQTLAPAEVLIVDNGSSDGSVAAARGRPELRVLSPGGNTGFARGNNLAADEARGDWLALLNPDAYPAPDWLERLAAATTRWPEAAMFGSTQLDHADPSRLDGAGDAYFAFGCPWRGGHGHPAGALPPEGEVFAACGAAMLFRRDVFLALGGFDERFFCYGEDVDLGFRLRLAGGRCVQVPDAVVRHEGSGVSGRHSDFTTYHGHRNRVWTYAKGVPGPLLALTLPGHLVLNALLWINAARRGGGKAYGRAVWDALLGLGPVWRDRRRLQRGRTASVSEVAAALCWSPLRFARRAPHVRDAPPR